MCAEGWIAGAPVQHHALGVGQNDGNRLAGELVREITDDVTGAISEAGVPIRIGIVRHIETIRGYVPISRPDPRRQDATAHNTGLHGLCGKEPFPRAGQEWAGPRRLAYYGSPSAVSRVRSSHKSPLRNLDDPRWRRHTNIGNLAPPYRSGRCGAWQVLPN